MRENRSQIMAFRLPPDRQSAVKTLATRRGVSVSELLRMLIERELYRSERKQVQPMNDRVVSAYQGADNAVTA